MTRARPPRNRRRLTDRRPRNLLEVQVRTRTATRKRMRLIMKVLLSLILLSVLGVAGFYGVRAGLQKFFLNNPDYRIAGLDVQLDGAMSREELMELANVSPGDNLFTLNIAEMERRLRADARVAEVGIERRFPNKLSITLTRRRPVAWVSREDVRSGTGDPDAAMLIASDATLMPSMPGYDIHTGYLPTIFGVRLDEGPASGRLSDSMVRAALDLIAAVDQDPESIFQIRAMDIRKPYRIEVVTDRNVRVQFAPEDFAPQVSRLNVILKMAIDSGRELETVNLLIHRNTPVTFVRPVSAPPEPAAAPTETKKPAARATRRATSTSRSR